MQAIDNIKKIVQEIRSEIEAKQDRAILKDKYLSKQSYFHNLRQNIYTLSQEDKREFGLLYNQALEILSGYINQNKQQELKAQDQLSTFDYSPAFDRARSSAPHPISALMDLVLRAGINLGFDVFSEGPEVENDWYNFTALNIGLHHPARDMWDTFYLNDKDSSSDGIEPRYLMRTHTSPMQIRYMQSHEPPIKALFPGRVFRNEDEDSTHLATFYQLEGLVIGSGVSMGHLKYYLKQILSVILEDEIEIRLRSSYFPFTEPSVEIDVLYHNKWLEIAGAGMVNAKVLSNMGLDHNLYSGFAFGFGIERIAVVKYGLSDIRDIWNLSLDNIYQKD